MANSAWRFKLYGTKIFTDVRGDESITYKVAVISNGDSEVVWLAICKSCGCFFHFHIN